MSEFIAGWKAALKVVGKIPKMHSHFNEEGLSDAIVVSWEEQ